MGGRGSDGDHQGDCETHGIFAGHGVASVRMAIRRCPCVRRLAVRLSDASEDLGYSAQAKRIVIPHEVALLDNEGVRRNAA